MKLIKKLLFILLILISTVAVAGPLELVELSIAPKSVPEPTQMLILGICLIGMASYGRRKIFKK